MRFVNINFEQIRQTPMGGWYTTVRSQPSWVTKLAGLAAMLVVVVPVLVLVTAAVLTFAAVFVIGSLVHRVGAMFSGLLGSGKDSGRRNVRVVRHEPR